MCATYALVWASKTSGSYLELIALGDQVAHLNQELLVGGHVLNSTLVILVPRIDLALDMVALRQESLVLGDKVRQDLVCTKPSRVSA